MEPRRGYKKPGMNTLKKKKRRKFFRLKIGHYLNVVRRGIGGLLKVKRELRGKFQWGQDRLNCLGHTIAF